MRTEPHRSRNLLHIDRVNTIHVDDECLRGDDIFNYTIKPSAVLYKILQHRKCYHDSPTNRISARQRNEVKQRIFHVPPFMLWSGLVWSNYSSHILSLL